MNSDKERSVHNLSTKTLSAWTLLHNIFYSNSSNIYKNAFYFSNGSRVLYPSVVSRHLIYWNEMFSRWDNFKQTTELIPKSLHLPLSHFIGNVLGNFEDADSLTRSENHDNQKTLKLGIFRTFSDKYLNHSKSQNLQISTNESSMSSQNLSTSLTDNVKTIISRWPFFWQSVLTVFADQINVQNSFDNQESNSDPLLNNRSVLFSAELNQSVSSIDTELNNIAITTNELDEDPDSD